MISFAELMRIIFIFNYIYFIIHIMADKKKPKEQIKQELIKEELKKKLTKEQKQRYKKTKETQ